jgi:hypothetical protein
MLDACAQVMVEVHDVFVKLSDFVVPAVDAAMCRSTCRAKIYLKPQLQIQVNDGTCCLAVSIGVSSNK